VFWDVLINFDPLSLCQIISQTRSGLHQMTTTGRGCVNQNPLMLSCQKPRVVRTIGPFGLLVHIHGTVFLRLSRKLEPFLLSKTV